jgi:DNA-binding transcriptional LysR family regulator
MMDIRQLDMFRAVAEEGSFTRAAQRLHVSQSAISRQIKLLEDELGGLVLHRGARRVTLTHPGELLLRMASRVQQDMQEVVSQISDTHELRRGTLTLAGGMTVCMYILPRLLKRYRSLYKQVDLRVASGSAEEIQRMLSSHEVDLALMTLPVVARDLEVLPVLKEEMVVVTAPGHPLSRKRAVEAAELGRFPLIVYEPGSNTRKVIDQFFIEEQIPMEVAMETENVEIIKAMVAAGLGVTLIPYMSIARELRHGRFAYSRVRGRRLYRETGWVYLKADHVPRTITEMLRVFEALKEQFVKGLVPRPKRRDTDGR